MQRLADAQRVMLGMEITPDVAAEAARRMEAGVKPDPEDKCPQGRSPQARDEVAGLVGLNSGRTDLGDPTSGTVGPEVRARDEVAGLVGLNSGRTYLTSVTSVAQVPSSPVRTTDEVAGRVGLNSGRTYERNAKTVE